MRRSSVNVINIIKEKVQYSDKSLMDIFLSFDENRDGNISFEEFRKAFVQANLDIEENIIR